MEANRSRVRSMLTEVGHRVLYNRRLVEVGHRCFKTVG